MLSKLVRRTFILGLILSVSACGLIRDRSNDYLEEQEGKPLKVPDWYESDRIQSRYPIPAVDNPAITQQDYQLPPPPSGEALTSQEPFVIEQMDGQQWLWVNNTPGRAWPMLDKFLQSRGMDVAHENIELGLVQSSVMQAGRLSDEYFSSLKTVDGKLHVIVFKLSQGVRRNSSEIQVRLVPVESLNAHFLPWTAGNSVAPSEFQILKDLKLYMETNQDDKTFSLVAQEMGGPSKVTLVSEDAQAYLRFDLDYDRSWGVVTRSVRDANVRVIDRDRSQGLFYVNYEEPVEMSLWGKIFGTGGKVDTPNYLLKLERSDNYIVLDVTGLDNQPVERDLKVKLLSLLLEHIS